MGYPILLTILPRMYGQDYMEESSQKFQGMLAVTAGFLFGRCSQPNISSGSGRAPIPS